jgi:tetratricopeptide (TPR) repeat protein
MAWHQDSAPATNLSPSRKDLRRKQGKYCRKPVKAYHEALELYPEDAVNDRSVAHNQLGLVYDAAGDIDGALSHYRESIRYKESGGDIYGAAQTRLNVAVVLAQSGRFLDAREYARAAHDCFASFGTGAAADVQDARGLIEWIERAIAGKIG